MRNTTFGVGALLAVAFAGAGAVVACGSDFSAGDCADTRTCPAAAGEPNAGGTGSDAKPNGGTGGTEPTGGTGGTEPSSAGAPTNEGGQDSSAAGGMGEGGTANSQPVNPAPRVTSITPNSDATNVEPDAVVTIEFSEPVAAATVNDTSVKLLEGSREIHGTVAYADSKVTLTPAEPLALLATYTVSVSTAVTDLEGLPLEEGFEAKFTARDGTFTMEDVVTAPASFMSEKLPINALGEVLVSWIDVGDSKYCPPFAQWFSRGQELGEAHAFTPPDLTSECHMTAAGANAGGIAAVAWQVTDGPRTTGVQQFRAGKWGTGDGTVATGSSSDYLRVAVAPDGSVSFFQDKSPGMTVYRTDAGGKWVAKPDVVDTKTTVSVQGPEIAFDSAGNGVAIWRAKTSADVEQIMSSRYTAGKWGPAQVLPGSVAASTGSDHERGVPAVALDTEGNGMALWVNKKGPGADEPLMASSFSAKTGWGAPVAVASDLPVRPTYEAPGLVFDGTAFVAAFTAFDGDRLLTYTSRYDRGQNVWQMPEAHETAAESDAAARMPALAADPRGNLILVWASDMGNRFKLVYQRYANGAWSSTEAVPGGTITNKSFGTGHYPFPLSVAENGLGAMAWQLNGQDGSGIRLASFY